MELFFFKDLFLFGEQQTLYGRARLCISKPWKRPGPEGLENRFERFHPKTAKSAGLPTREKEKRIALKAAPGIVRPAEASLQTFAGRR